MEDAGAKRAREDSDKWLPHSKRPRAADHILLGIFDDGDWATLSSDAGDIDTVMKSLEQEIASPVLSSPPRQQPVEKGAKPPPATSTSDGEPSRTDLCFLLEASDDELGLPPTVLPLSEGGEAAEDNSGEVIEGLGQMWGFPDEMPISDGALGLVQSQNDVAGGGGAFFDHDDAALSWPSDFLDFSSRLESLPAV